MFTDFVYFATTQHTWLYYIPKERAEFEAVALITPDEKPGETVHKQLQAL